MLISFSFIIFLPALMAFSVCGYELCSDSIHGETDWQIQIIEHGLLTGSPAHLLREPFPMMCEILIFWFPFSLTALISERRVVEDEGPDLSLSIYENLESGPPALGFDSWWGSTVTKGWLKVHFRQETIWLTMSKTNVYRRKQSVKSDTVQYLLFLIVTGFD